MGNLETSRADTVKSWGKFLPLLVFTIALVARLAPGARTIDDAFITYRYVRNILAGVGFVYNPGEHVLGTTTPLYTLLLALLGSISGGVNAPFPIISAVTNAFFDAFTCLLLFKLGRRLGYTFAGLGAALVWAIAPFSVTFAIGGLETSLYVLLLVSIISAYLAERYRLAAFLAALAFLTRPDALILIAPLALDRFFRVLQTRERLTEISQRKKLFAEILVFTLPILIWSIFAFSYFGSPIPHSISAKTLAYRLSPEEGLVRLLQHYATPFMDQNTFGASMIGWGFVLYLFLNLVGSLNAMRATRRIWPFVIYPWLYLIIFAAANPLIFRWYLTPPLPAYILFILVGAEQLIGSVFQAVEGIPGVDSNSARQSTVRIIHKSIMVIIVIAVPFILSLRDWQFHPDHGLDRPAPAMAWYKLELLYKQAADDLLPEVQNTTNKSIVLAAGDVGVLGYRLPVHILDTVGLNTPQSSNYYPLDPSYYVIAYAIPPDLILDQQPNYVVFLEVYGRRGLLQDARFSQAYKLKQKIPTDIYGSDGLLVYERINQDDD